VGALSVCELEGDLFRSCVDGGEQFGLSSLVCRYSAFPNILDPHGQRSNALEHAGGLAKLRDSAVAVGAFRRVIRAA